MSNKFIPTEADVARYLSLRSLGRKMADKILKTKLISKQVMEEIGQALGMFHNGVLLFDTEDMTSVLMDCCIHDWVGKDGKRVIEKYVEQFPAPVETDEHVLQQAYVNATYRLLWVQDVQQGAGIYCTDLLTDEELFIMDINMSQSLPLGVVIASRTTTPDRFSMTTGTGLPMIQTKQREEINEFMEHLKIVLSHIPDPHRQALMLVRMCLQSGAAERVEYDMEESTSRPRSPSFSRAAPSSIPVSRFKPRPKDAPPRNAPCPCGSGKKYKKCCEPEQLAK